MKLYLLTICLFFGYAGVKAPKAHVQTVSSQIVSSMTLNDLAAIRPVVYYKSKTLGVKFYETQHLTWLGKQPFLIKYRHVGDMSIAYRDTVRAAPCWFKVRASKNGKEWSSWSKPILIE